MLANTGLSEWETEYKRLLRRERYEYERDYKHGLVYYDDYPEWGDAMTDGRDMAAQAIARVMVERATASCTADERELLHLVYYEGYSILALSRALGVPYRTLGYRLDRVLQKARRALECRPTLRIAATAVDR